MWSGAACATASTGPVPRLPLKTLPHLKHKRPDDREQSPSKGNQPAVRQNGTLQFPSSLQLGRHEPRLLERLRMPVVHHDFSNM